MTKRILVFFIRFIVVSLVIYLAWEFAYGGRIYTLLVAWGAKPILALTGNSLDVDRAMQVSEEISLNPIVYLSLVIAVKGVAWKERIRPALIGIGVLTVANVITVFLVFLSAISKSEGLWTGTEFFNLTINFFVPILLWALLMPKGELMPVSPSSE
jgi:hypothetical protein